MKTAKNEMNLLPYGDYFWRSLNSKTIVFELRDLQKNSPYGNKFISCLVVFIPTGVVFTTKSASSIKF